MQEKRYTKKQIINIANDILDAFNVREYPLKIVKLAEEIGLNVYNSIFDRDDVAGMIKADEKKIYINKTDTPQRQRFTIAHEIGHYVLHYQTKEYDFNPNKHVSFRNSLSSLGFSLKEVEANFFASNILIPEAEIKKIYNYYSFNEMLDYFQVSKSALTYRLEFLGLE